MLTPGARAYTIDLCQSEGTRWMHVIEEEVSIAKRLVEEALDEIPLGPRSRSAASWAFERLYRLSGGRYAKEMAAWARALNISSGLAVALNASYELSHLSEYAAGIRMPMFGCTAGAKWIPGSGMVHMRTLDWPLSGIGDATRAFRFVDGGREFFSAGILGFSGVLSGVLPGGFSISLNWAPPQGRPTFDWGPSFLVREVLEGCDSYSEAVEMLTNSRISTAAFFAVCGLRQSEACVVERGRTKAAVRKIRGGVLTQANHHVARAFRAGDYWKGYEVDLADSHARADVLKQRLFKVTERSSIISAARCLGSQPIQNEQTMQQVIMSPASGELKIWRRTS